MSEATDFNFSYNDSEKGETTIPLLVGHTVFVLGANGSGKSGLLQILQRLNSKTARRMAAHRETTLNSNSSEITPATKLQLDRSLDAAGMLPASRYFDSQSSQRVQVTIFELLRSANTVARRVDALIRAKDADGAISYADANPRPLDTLNELLETSNLNITLSIEGDERIVASKNNGEPYSIAELSDGERNALLIASDVLIAREGTLFLIDEPERHLHRSIISPLLSSLFRKRPDCAFVVATHELDLPLDNPDSRILLLRACIWNEKAISGWDADLLESTDEIPLSLKRAILGPRRGLLFVEGTDSSLDCSIYSILFPDLFVIAKGGCREVERAVNGVNDTASQHSSKAYGLIDADDRLPKDVEQLKKLSVFSLLDYSVESLYYSAEMIRYVASKQAEISKLNCDALVANASRDALDAVRAEKDKLCARVCQSRIRARFRLPGWKDILKRQPYKLEVDVTGQLDEECKIFDSYIGSTNLDGIVGRYPVRESGALCAVAAALGFRGRVYYEDAVRKVLQSDSELCAKVRQSLGDICSAVQEQEPAR